MIPKNKWVFGVGDLSSGHYFKDWWFPAVRFLRCSSWFSRWLSNLIPPQVLHFYGCGWVWVGVWVGVGVCGWVGGVGVGGEFVQPS